MKNINTIISSLFIALLVLPITSCSEEKPKRLTAMEEAKARLAEHEAKYGNPKKEMNESKTGMPEWAPDGFPYPEDTILRFHAGGLRGGMVNLTSDLSLKAINNFYLQAMPKDGWIKGSTQKREYYYLFKKTGKEAIITLLNEPGEENKTRIKLTIVM